MAATAWIRCPDAGTRNARLSGERTVTVWTPNAFCSRRRGVIKGDPNREQAVTIPLCSFSECVSAHFEIVRQVGSPTLDWPKRLTAKVPRIVSNAGQVALHLAGHQLSTDFNHSKA